MNAGKVAPQAAPSVQACAMKIPTLLGGALLLCTAAHAAPSAWDFEYRGFYDFHGDDADHHAGAARAGAGGVDDAGMRTIGTCDQKKKS